MTSVGIDYSASEVYIGVLNDHNVMHTCQLKLKDKADVAIFWNSLQAILKALNNTYDTSPNIYLEEFWLNTMKRAYTGLQMGRMATYIETAAIAVGLKVNFVMPNSWRKVVYGTAKLEDRKEYAREFVREQFGYDTKFKYQHNIAEAICIAHYGNIRQIEMY